MVEQLVDDGCDRSEIEKQLFRLGYEKEMSARSTRYKCLDKRKYIVNYKFPQITNRSFKNDHLPRSITKIEYTVDLDGLCYTKW